MIVSIVRDFVALEQLCAHYKYVLLLLLLLLVTSQLEQVQLIKCAYYFASCKLILRSNCLT
jgi:hypothetical protein